MQKRLFLISIILLAAANICSQSTDDKRVLLHKFKTPDHRIRDVAFSADGKMVAAGYGFYDDGGITVWDLASKKILATLLEKESKKGGINKIAFSRNGGLFAAADSNGNVWLWKVGVWLKYKKLLTNKGDSNGLVFSPDGSKLAFSSEESALVYDLTTSSTDLIAVGKKDSKEFDGISITPDGKQVVVSGSDGIQIWDVETRKILSRWKKSAFNFFGQLSPNGKYFVSGGGAIYGEKSIEIRSFPDGKTIKDLTEFRNGIFALAISNSGKYFALGGGTYGGEGTYSLWSFDTFGELGFSSFGDSPVQGLAFSSDDKMLAVGSGDGYVLVYGTDTFRGGEIKQQAERLCGEIKTEDGRAFIAPISKLPGIMSRDFVYPWRLEIVNSDAVSSSSDLPVVLQNWAIESSSAGDKARVSKFKPILDRESDAKNYVVLGVGENPGYGYAIKIFNDGNFVAANRDGKCLSYGNLEQFKTSYNVVKQRLLDEGFLAIPKEPLTIGADHFRTAFIEIATDGVSEIRSDADSFELLVKQKGETAKRKAFSTAYTKERAFIDSLLKAGFSIELAK